MCFSCSVDSGCNSFECSVKHAGRCRLLSEATPAVTTLFSDSEIWLYVKDVAVSRSIQTTKVSFEL